MNRAELEKLQKKEQSERSKKLWKDPGYRKMTVDGMTKWKKKAREREEKLARNRKARIVMREHTEEEIHAYAVALIAATGQLKNKYHDINLRIANNEKIEKVFPDLFKEFQFDLAINGLALEIYTFRKQCEKVDLKEPKKVKNLLKEEK